MFIDVGVFNAEECRKQMGIRIGDPIVPQSPFTPLNSGDVVMGKALDDRLGCALIIECLQELANRSHPNRVYGAFTVQEEIGRANSSLSGWSVHLISVLFWRWVCLPTPRQLLPINKAMIAPAGRDAGDL